MQRYVLLLCLLLFSAAAHAAGITPEMRAEDSRLQEKRVTFAASRVYVGEFLEEVARQTGVQITAEDRNTALGEIITVHLKNVPLDDSLDALWSLVSYKKAEWRWVRTGERRKYAYQFQRPDRAMRYSKNLADQAQQEFEGHIHHMMEWAELKPEDLQKRDQEDPRAHHSLTKGIGVSPAMRYLSTAFSKAELTELWQGKQIETKFSDLNEHGRACAEALVGAMKLVNPDGTSTSIGRPASLIIKVNHDFSQGIGPNLWIGCTVDGLIDSTGMDGIMDIDEDKWKGRFKEEWNLPEDKPSDPAEDSVAFPKQENGKEDNPVSFMALFGNSPGFSTEKGVTWKDILKSGAGSDSFQYKWRCGILLAQYQNDLLLRYKSPRIAWSAVKEARKRVANAPNRLLETREMARFAHDFTREQIDALIPEMPFLDAARQLYPLFHYLADKEERLNDALSTEGLPVNPALRAIFAQAKATPEMLEKARTVRLVTKDEPAALPATATDKPESPRSLPARVIIVQLLDKEGALQGQLAARWVATPTPSPRQP